MAAQRIPGEVIRKLPLCRRRSNSIARKFSESRERCGGQKRLLSATNPIAVFFDADLSTPIDELPKIVEPIARGEVDIAFGSRALNRKLIGNRQPWRREQGGRVFNLLVRVATGLPFWDTQCGFKAFWMEACRPIIEAAKIIGFGFDVELLLLAQRAGLRLREIPVRWNHHEGSKVRFVHDSVRMLREVLSLRANNAVISKAESFTGEKPDSR
jgi:hypothetical protein